MMIDRMIGPKLSCHHVYCPRSLNRFIVPSNRLAILHDVGDGVLSGRLGKADVGRSGRGRLLKHPEDVLWHGCYGTDMGILGCEEVRKWGSASQRHACYGAQGAKS